MIQLILMTQYKLYKTTRWTMNAQEAGTANRFVKRLPYAERLRQAYFLILKAYGFSMENHPKLDLQHFSCRKMNP
ncbi:hypothetical protein ACTJJB_03550 [Chitinophaga sp. 22536]|uniref:hypothetical protein n=1 Tax=unclassified Chitinophaga TaxID=2619133 RepID=UPI003F834505